MTRKTLILDMLDMDFPKRVVALRKQKSWTQQHLAELVGVRVLQIRRYESGASQPTLDAIRRLALALRVTTDELIFDNALLVVVHTYHELSANEASVRMISARAATQHEQRHYEAST